MDQTSKCGFCKMGKEVENICGRLWQDEVHKCIAHQRCMQYSALLCQYKMEKFGGFKVKEVLREQARGKKLKCSICHKLGKSSKSKVFGSASAGCAIQKCKKTFHFYCARTDEKALSRRIVMSDRQETMVMYRVFCSKEHEDLFLEQGMMLTEDSGNEEYPTESEDGQDETSEQRQERQEKVNKDLKDNKEQGFIQDPVEKIKKPKRKKLDPGLDVKESNAGGAVNKSLGKDNLDNKVQKSKRRKLDKKEADLDEGTTAQKFIICFTENSRNIPPTKFETLVNKAKELFAVEANNIFMWKYDVERFTCQHMLLLIIEIAKALKDKNDDRLRHLLCFFGKSDIAAFDDEISRGETDNNNSSSAADKDDCCHQSLRKNIVKLFVEVNAKFNDTVMSYCTVESLDLAHVAYLVLSDDTDSTGDMRRHMKQSYSLVRPQEDRNNGSCEKTLKVHALDLEANLFHDVQNQRIKIQESGNAREEAKILSNWFRDEYDTIYGLEVFPNDELLLQNSTLTAVDYLCDHLKSMEADESYNPFAVVVKPLDGRIAIASEYLRKCISKVIDDRLTSQHDVFMFVGVCSQNVDFRKVSQFLPDFVLSKKCGIGTRAFVVGPSGGDFSIVLHFWINV